MIIPIPSSAEMIAACLAIGAIQLLVTLRFFIRARKSAAANGTRAALPVAVIVPCKGAPERLARNIGSILEQDYPAEAGFIFVVPSRTDPAWKVLPAILRGYPAVNTKLIVSDAVPVACGEHILNMLCGVANASQSAEALVFANNDIEVPPSWLINMTEPLRDPAVGAVTAPLIFLPGAACLCKTLRCAWEAVGIPYLDLTGCVAGASFSILKKNYSGLGIEELWRKSLSDDLALSRRLKKSGKTVRFAYRALPASEESCEPGPLLDMFNRWMVFFKFYFPRVWFPGAVLTAFKFYAVFWSASGHTWLPAALLFAMDSAHIYFTLCVLKFCRPGAFAGIHAPYAAVFPAIAALSAPLLQLVYAVNFISSAFAARVRWGGYTYRIRAWDRITVESGTGNA